MKRIGNPFGGIFQKLKYAILFSLPKPTRRLLFIASVYLDMGLEHSLNKDELERLNRELHLARDTDALKLPTYLNSAKLLSFGDALRGLPERITRHRDEEVYLREICEQILAITPKWMFYGRQLNTVQSDMVADLMALFKVHPSISKA